MTTPELLALSIALSVATAALAYGGIRVFERVTADPILRERAWTAALFIPVLPVVMVAVLLTGPRPVVEAPEAVDASVTFQIEAVGKARRPVFQTGQIALAVLGLAALLTLARGVGLAGRTIRLRRLIHAAQPADADLLQVVGAAAEGIGVAMPTVRLCRSSSEAMVAGFFKAVLILPEALAADPISTSFRTVYAHELTHLKRGDHRALWVEEVLLTLLAINPVLRVIRDRRAAAREEACDAQVLAQADGDTRRLYARSLLDALRVPAGRDVPALTFTSSRRIFVMHRLKAILSPVPVASTRSRLAVLGLGVALTVVAGTSSVAVAARREPVVMPRPSVASSPVSVASPVPAAASTPVVASVPAAEPAPAPAREPIVAPQTQVTTNPSWSQSPTPLRFPAAALEQELTSGSAELSCSVESDGRVSDCTILTEEPLGAGFGGAALEAAARARISPQSVPGIAAGGLRFVVRLTREVE